MPGTFAATGVLGLRSANHPPAEPRHASRNVVAFALQGGGSLAAGQVGMLRALVESGVVPDLIGGTSAGALNAVAFSADPSSAGVDRLEELWLAMRRRRVARLSIRTLACGLIGRGDGLFSHDALHRFLATNMPTARLDDTAVPVFVVATDLVTGAAVILSDGDAVSALLASAAFPGLYPPVRVSGRHLIDGGVAADVPVLQAEALGATTTYVLPAAVFDGGDRRPRGPLPMAYHALGQILDAAARRDASAAKGAVHVLPAPMTRTTHPLDFRETQRLIADGYRLAATWLAEHRAATQMTAATA